MQVPVRVFRDMSPEQEAVAMRMRNKCWRVPIYVEVHAADAKIAREMVIVAQEDEMADLVQALLARMSGDEVRVLVGNEAEIVEVVHGVG